MLGLGTFAVLATAVVRPLVAVVLFFSSQTYAWKSVKLWSIEIHLNLDDT
jgi:hypothetical protein